MLQQAYTPGGPRAATSRVISTLAKATTICICIYIYVVILPRTLLATTQGIQSRMCSEAQGAPAPQKHQVRVGLRGEG